MFGHLLAAIKARSLVMDVALPMHLRLADQVITWVQRVSHSKRWGSALVSRDARTTVK